MDTVASGVQRIRAKSAIVGLLTCGALAATAAPPVEAASDGPPGSAKASCRAPASLPNYFQAVDGRKIKGSAACGQAKKVAKGFAKKCARAYAAQGTCKVPAGGKFRCRSAIVGPAAKGAPSRIKCRKRKSTLSFVIASFPPIDSDLVLLGRVREPLADAASYTRAPLGISAAWNEAAKCIDVAVAPRSIDPPPVDQAGFEIRLVGQLPQGLADELQQALLSNGVWQTFVTGLAGRPRNQPARLPIILTGGRLPEGNTGVMINTCANLAQDADLVSVNQGRIERFQTAAHELYHAFSNGVKEAEDNWYEEASATWAEAKAGFGESPRFDVLLQYPDTALDNFNTPPKAFAYAMARFIQFLEDRGLISSDQFWDTQRRLILAYGTNEATTQALDQALRARGTSLSYEAAAFWGDRLRAKPAHGPSLQPAGPNSREIEIAPGTTEIPLAPQRLHTKLLDFTLADNVKRVEFEFEAPADGHFWGAVDKDTSEELTNKTMAFCVKGAGQNELDWPIRFPVTFTNGSLSGTIEGKITIRAQRGESQCGNPAPGNRACQLLAEAGVSSIFGPGQYPFFNTVEDGPQTTWICFYEGSTAEVNLNLAHYRGVPTSTVRNAARQQISALGLQPIKVGDLAGVGTMVADDEGTLADVMVIASGREIVLLIVGPAGDQARTIRLGKRIVGQIN